MFSRLKRLFKRDEDFSASESIVDDDLDWLQPPEDPRDAAGWDRYWIEHVTHGLGPPLFDMFCDDRDLIQAMRAEGTTSVLCAGSGISQEPRALSQAGFQVTAIDLSPVAVEIAQQYEFSAEAFEHYCDPDMKQTGGHLETVVGDILDSANCLGPFDVIIERSTAQGYFDCGIEAVLGALERRLSQDGIFFSHCHDGGWRPPAEPRHFTEPWFRENQWTFWNGGPGRKPSGRVAWLFTSTG